MLSALYQNKTIYIHDYSNDELKKISNAKELTCPDCGDLLIFKQCYEKQHHFAHIQRDCSFPFREPESIEHERGKLSLFQWLTTQYGEDDCKTEKRIIETNQRSDTFVLSLNMAVEFQCSPIQATTWETRTNLYKEANVTDIWILGYSMHKKYSSNRYTHKLNPLEERLFKEYGKIIYYDVLTKQFVFLFVEEKIKNYYVGIEYFLKPEEVTIKDFQMISKYDFFINMQKRRYQFIESETKKAESTDTYLKNVKKEVQAEKVLATSKQIKFIKALLYKQGKTIPYKFHGLLKEEADAIIKQLLSENKQEAVH